MEKQQYFFIFVYDVELKFEISLLINYTYVFCDKYTLLKIRININKYLKKNYNFWYGLQHDLKFKKIGLYQKIFDL